MTRYICDGVDSECRRSNCYVYGGECRHTTKVEHAKNFYKDFDGDYTEKDDFYDQSTTDFSSFCFDSDKSSI